MGSKAGMRFVRRTLLLPALLATVLCAQDYRGRIQGLVSDSTNAVIAGANVTLSNINTGITAARVTNETGRYIFDLVEPGTYRITVEQPMCGRP
jgi:protocatechuate 3,4-dioxygenase beta subunit